MEPLISVQEAELIIAEELATLSAESVPLARAAGRVLAGPIRADRDLPPFDRVMMDGVAVSASSAAEAGRRLPVARTLSAGEPAVEADPATAVEIMTGAVLPGGLDCVVPYEEMTLADGEVTIAGDFELAAGRNVHRQGSDFAAGRELVGPGSVVGSREIAIAASCGCEQLRVTRSCRVALVSSGDELVDVGDPVAPHQIRRSNTHGIAGGLASLPMVETSLHHFPDDPEAIREGLSALLVSHDVIVVSGGASRGKKDYIPEIAAQLGAERKFHGVAQRPGKPFWFARAAGTVIFGLPGNPVSTLVGFRRYVLPSIRRLCGAEPEPQRWAVLSQAFEFAPALTLFLPTTAESRRDGVLAAFPSPVNNSGDYASLMPSAGFVELPAEDLSEFPAGFAARYYDWR